MRAVIIVSRGRDLDMGRLYKAALALRSRPPGAAARSPPRRRPSRRASRRRLRGPRQHRPDRARLVHRRRQGARRARQRPRPDRSRRRKIEAKPAPPPTAPPVSRRAAADPNRPLEDAARLGRLQRHHDPAPQRRRPREDLRPHPRRRRRLDLDPAHRHRPAPPDAPQAVKDVINNANMIVGRPYVWGGGHGSFYSNGYDCSGSVSFALFGGGLIPRTAHLQRRSRAGARPAPASGSPSTPTPATPSPRSPACAGTRSATSRAPAPAGTSPRPPPTASSSATRRATECPRLDSNQRQSA